MIKRILAILLVSSTPFIAQASMVDEYEYERAETPPPITTRYEIGYPVAPMKNLERWIRNNSDIIYTPEHENPTETRYILIGRTLFNISW